MSEKKLTGYSYFWAATWISFAAIMTFGLVHCSDNYSQNTAILYRKYEKEVERLSSENRQLTTKVNADRDKIYAELRGEWNAMMAPNVCLEEQQFETCLKSTPHIHGVFTSSDDIIEACRTQARMLSLRRRDSIPKECTRAE